jgi:hypothetical protein
MLTGTDIVGFAHAMANFPNVGGGLNQIQVFFVQPGVDVCLTPTFCYSPDNLATHAFCGYHSSATFSDVTGPVLFAVVGYANVPGCQVLTGTPNGQLVDSEANILSHEVFETITDPFGDAWWNAYNLGSRGEEIGDECAFVTPPTTTAPGYFNPSVFNVHGVPFGIQLEYSNARHGCVSSTSE